MSANIEIRSGNKILTTAEFENFFASRKGEVPAEGQHDFRPRVNSIFAIPNELLEELREMLANTIEEADESEFDSDGELSVYHEDETIDKLLKLLLYAERPIKTFNVTVEFTVEAFTQEEAESKVQEEISWGADYNITSVYED